jgi:hypothetical protein
MTGTGAPLGTGIITRRAHNAATSVIRGGVRTSRRRPAASSR